MTQDRLLDLTLAANLIADQNCDADPHEMRNRLPARKKRRAGPYLN